MKRENSNAHRAILAAVTGAILLAVISSGCVRVKVDPIHITMDVNVRMEKELDSFFGDIDATAAKKAAALPAKTDVEPTLKKAEKG